MREYQLRNQQVLDRVLNDDNVPSRLASAMCYSVLSQGKRFRAMLVYAAGMSIGAPLEKLDVVAAALECIHAYSLIHDDLPAMDDDNLRRGLPTSHIKYDEATAILAGDALLTFAFELINRESSPLNDTQCRKITAQLSRDAGPIGMVGGQMLDIQATPSPNAVLDLKEKPETSLAELEDIHRRKTGALIRSAVLCGALCSDTLSTKQQQSLEQYATSIGLAFQVVDDILDIESSTQELGKASGADAALGKATYPALIGLDASKKMAEKLYHQAIASISTISDNTPLSSDQSTSDNTLLLTDLANLVIKRTK